MASKLGLLSRGPCKGPVLFGQRTSHRVSASKYEQRKQQQKLEQQAQQTQQEEPVKIDNGPPVIREYVSFGTKVIESNQSLPEPEETDMWASENFEGVGETLSKYFVPGVIAIGVLIGAFAASQYNEGATAFLKSAPGPDEDAIIVSAEKMKTFQ